MARILVTGSKGQLGTELHLMMPEYPQHQFTFTDYTDLDITNAGAVQSFLAAHHFEYIINCAAYTAVDKAESDMENAFRLNAEAVGVLAKAAQEHGTRLIHISTDFVFDGRKHTPYLEEDAPLPLNIYGKSKWRGEEICLEENPASLILRTSWLYSPFGNNFVKTMQRLGSERKELGVISDQIGTPTYAFDLARCILQIIAQPEKQAGGIYHYSNEGVCSWYDFAVAVMDMSGLKCTVKPLETSEYPTPAKRGHYTVLNKKKIKQTFGITIPHWHHSLRECIHRMKTIS